MDNCDASIEMQVMDAIAQAKTDKVAVALAWLSDHGFVNRSQHSGSVEYVKADFAICEMTVDVMLEYSIGCDTWSCTCISSEGALCLMVSDMMHDMSGVPPAIQPEHVVYMNFDPGMSRIDMLSGDFMKWLRTYRAGNFKTAQQALEKYCRALVEAHETLKATCGSHAKEWWIQDYLSETKIQ